jgi:hypothetical protein
MWCCRCQQEVPAARGLAGPPKCPRCSAVLLASAEARTVAAISDCGVELDTFSRATQPLPTVRERLGGEPLNQQLRRLERKLRPPVRRDDAHGFTTRFTSVPPFDAAHEDVSDDLQIAAANLRTEPGSARTTPTWGISLLLAAGGTAFMCGVLLLVAANMLLHPGAWRWGFAATITGEGLLISGLAAMATRLWRNSRRINAQLDGIDVRLVEVQSTLTHAAANVTTGSLRGALRRLDRPALPSST